MNYTIQPDIFVENCIVCGSKPVINQTKKNFTIICSNSTCTNKVVAPFIDIDLWNKMNKKKVTITPPKTNDKTDDDDMTALKMLA